MSQSPAPAGEIYEVRACLYDGTLLGVPFHIRNYSYGEPAALDRAVRTYIDKTLRPAFEEESARHSKQDVESGVYKPFAAVLPHFTDLKLNVLETTGNDIEPVLMVPGAMYKRTECNLLLW